MHIALVILLLAGPALLALMVFNRLRLLVFSESSRSKKQLQVTFIHPDLGIGGAERLILDAALALKSRGNHTVRIVTNFFDKERCFHDAKSMEVVVAGSSIVPRHIAGKGHVMFASIRMFLAALWCAFALSDTDVFVVDQVSLAMVPLRLFSPRPVLFYCHFPDQLCDSTRFITNSGGGADINLDQNKQSSKANDKRSFMRQWYRSVFDNIEAATMHFASRIVCNSEFTLGVTLDLFPSLSRLLPTDREISVLNPPVDVERLLNGEAATDKDLQKLSENFTLLSVNRYERKKNIQLAIEALAEFKQQLGTEVKFQPKLIHAGGYDERLPENREHYAELVELAKQRGVSDDVIFLRSISDETKRQLLREVACAVVYTPTNEHFGIVPVEAMACRRPVIAVNRGGPKESVGTDGSCGLLTDPDAKSFAKAMMQLWLMGKPKREEMGARGKERVERLFTLPSFGTKLCGIVEGLAKWKRS